MADMEQQQKPTIWTLNSLEIGGGFAYAITSGFFAALAAVFAKLSLNDENIKEIICSDSFHHHLSSLRPFFEIFNFYDKPLALDTFFGSVLNCKNVCLALRAGGIAMIFVSNVIMFRSFSKALLLCSSTAEATTTNTAANFCFSALFGWLIFGETFSIKWYIGTSLIIIGLAFINSSKQGCNEATTETKKAL